MNTQALQEIDFFRIREEAASYCITEEARRTFLQREPLTDSKEIEALKGLGREWTRFLSASCKNPVFRHRRHPLGHPQHRSPGLQ